MEGWKEEEVRVTLEMRTQRTVTESAAAIEGVRNDDSVQLNMISYEEEEESKEEEVVVMDEGGMHMQQHQHLVVDTSSSSSHTMILSSIDIQGNVQSSSVPCGLVNGEQPASYAITKGSQVFPVDIIPADDDREQLLKPDIVMEEAENGMEYAACATEIADGGADTALAAAAADEQTQLRKMDTEPVLALDAMPKSSSSARNASSLSIIEGDAKVVNGDSDEEPHLINEKLDFGAPEESAHISTGMTVTEDSSKMIHAKDESLAIYEEIPKAHEPSETIHNGHAVEAAVEYVTNAAGRGLALADEPKPEVEVLPQQELHPSAQSQDAELFSVDELVRGENVEEEAGKRIHTEPTEDAKSLEAHMDVTAKVPTVAELSSKRQPETEINEQDVQGIKGRKVWKRFGRRKYLGDVVGYDEENKWFKVAYEDGDEEELDVAEMREILLPPGTLPKSVIRRRRMIHPVHVEGSADRQRKSSRKRGRPPKKSQEDTAGTSSGMRKPERVVKRTYKRRKRQAQAQPAEEEECKEKSSTTQSTMTGNEASDTTTTSGGGEVLLLVEEEVGGGPRDGGAVQHVHHHVQVKSSSEQTSKRGRTKKKKKKLQSSDAELSTGSKPPQVIKARRGGRKREIQHDAERVEEVKASTSVKPPPPVVDEDEEDVAMADEDAAAAALVRRRRVAQVVTTTRRTRTTTAVHDDHEQEEEEKSMRQVLQVQEEDGSITSSTAAAAAAEMHKRGRERSETERRQGEVAGKEQEEKVKSQEEMDIIGEQSMVLQQQQLNVQPAGMDITTSDKEDRVLIGKRMQKHYKGALRSGRVTERLLLNQGGGGGVDTKSYYYKVKYEHGDEEELDANELQAVLDD